jgi:hypothetical protein
MNNQNFKFDIYSILGISIIFQFIWYYSTLPGSTLSFNNKKHPKPSLKIALKSYLIYIIPMIISLIFLNNKDENCMAINSYYNTICKK